MNMIIILNKRDRWIREERKAQDFPHGSREDNEPEQDEWEPESHPPERDAGDEGERG